MDWSHRLVIGNIHKNSLDELWNGAAITEQRAAQKELVAEVKRRRFAEPIKRHFIRGEIVMTLDGK